MRLGCVLLAAGGSSRFYSNKLLIKIGSRTMAEIAMDSIPREKFSHIVVATRYPEIVNFACQRGFSYIINETNYVSNSIRLGLTVVGDVDGCAFFVCDQPLLKKSSILRLIAAFTAKPDCIAALSHNGRKGNPVIFPKSCLAELMKLQGDQTGSQVILKYPDLLLLFPVEDATELYDVDTVQDMEILKNQSGFMANSSGGKLPYI